MKQSANISITRFLSKAQICCFPKYIKSAFSSILELAKMKSTVMDFKFPKLWFHGKTSGYSTEHPDIKIYFLENTLNTKPDRCAILPFQPDPLSSELFEVTIVSSSPFFWMEEGGGEEQLFKLTLVQNLGVKVVHQKLEETFARGPKSKSVYFQIFNSQIRSPVI